MSSIKVYDALGCEIVTPDPSLESQASRERKQRGRSDREPQQFLSSFNVEEALKAEIANASEKAKIEETKKKDEVEKPKSDRVKCDSCGKELSKRSLARHKKSCV